MVRAVDELGGQDFLLLEVSSFQLAHIVDFAPRVAVILNIRDDHFDWHPDLGDYIRSKALIWHNQAPGDYLILNLDDLNSVEAGEGAPSQHIYFSREPDPLAALYTVGGRMVSRLALRPEMALDLVEVMLTDELSLVGEHNLENALAAAAAAAELGVPPEAIARSLSGFRGLPHRLEPVAAVRGIRFVNDSKATNTDSLSAALRSFPEPVLLIAGGRDKGQDFRPLAPLIRERVALLILIGEAREKMERAWTGVPVQDAAGLEEAVRIGLRRGRPGQVVLLSPACASFDMFRDYEERGDLFRALARRLEEEERGGGEPETPRAASERK